MIDLSKLTDEDRGRILKATEEELGSTREVVLFGWNEMNAFVGWLDCCNPPNTLVQGAIIDPCLLSFTEKRATVAYRYGLQFRPCSIGAQPKGFIPDSTLLRSNDPDWKNPERRFGVMDYPEKLSERDEKAYELNYLGVVWRSPR